MTTEEVNLVAQTFSAKELAQQCGTDARTVRKFLREHLPKEAQPGQGGRYDFSKTEVQKLVKAYKAWAGGTTAKKAAAEKATATPAKAKVTKKAAATVVEEPPDEEVEEEGDKEPSAEDLEAIVMELDEEDGDELGDDSEDEDPDEGDEDSEDEDSDEPDEG